MQSRDWARLAKESSSGEATMSERIGELGEPCGRVLLLQAIRAIKSATSGFMSQGAETRAFLICCDVIEGKKSFKSMLSTHRLPRCMRALPTMHLSYRNP